jgi:hypothetical protein
MIRLLLTGALLAVVGCSAKYPEQGPCLQDADCQVCSPCGCAHAYSKEDIGTNTLCSTIEASESCPSLAPSNCESADVYQALCVSGNCQPVSR